jgi:hypothetical protein
MNSSSMLSKFTFRASLEILNNEAELALTCPDMMELFTSKISQ